MAINSTMNILGSVGRRGKNNVNDVRAVQTRLNDFTRPPRSFLKVDGKCGPTTEGVIADFQRVVCGSPNPDGKIDPGKKTHAALNDPASEGKWARMSIGSPAAPTAPTGQPGAAAKDVVYPPGATPKMREAINAMAKSIKNADELAILNAFLKTTPYAYLKTSLEVQGAVVNFADFALVTRQMRAAGNSSNEIVSFLTDAAKMKEANSFAKVLGIGAKYPQIFKAAKGLGTVASGAGILLCAAEITNHLDQKRYGAAAAECYGGFMGLAVPWAGFLSAVQGLVFNFAPGLKGNSAITFYFRYLNAADPVGLGKIAVDSLVTIIETVMVSYQKGYLDTGKMEILVDRMKKSPANLLVSVGEWVGDTAFDGVSGGMKLFDGLVERLRK